MIPHTYTSTAPNVVDVTVTCVMCGKDKTLRLPQPGYIAWTRGALVQDAFPLTPPGERELLISGTCEACFDSLFKS